ncbi:hypothetical protein [Janibacter sp. YB324]|uniref:hypothetical protein n=1 Tax=Janibacter sp. YB324 TaxID=2761047 RepID=UPI001624B337|nr:hypothetical protein [Janibacter sp. YB324]QNF93473.1 hypothetical protein H7A72_11930 [Janibacter sp. YB324]
MSTDRGRVVAELPLPLGPEATRLDAIAIAVALEDGCGVVLDDALITVEHLRDRESVQAVLDGLED